MDKKCAPKDLAMALSISKKRKKYASGGMISDSDESAPSYASAAEAIIARRKRKLEDGQVDIEANAEEMPNQFYGRNEEILKENYDSDLEDLEQPMDSNLKDDPEEMATSDRLDKISEIRRRMKSRMR